MESRDLRHIHSSWYKFHIRLAINILAFLSTAILIAMIGRVLVFAIQKFRDKSGYRYNH